MSEWLAQFIEQSGYLAVAFLMFAETLFPPIPSEVIMPLAGLAAAQNKLSLGGVMFAGTMGALLGNVFWYLLARTFGFDRFERFVIRHGRLMTMDKRDLEKSKQWFDRYGGLAVGVGRVVPTVRTLISVPAGVLKMRLLRFLFYTSLGTFVWTMLLTLAGYMLGSQYTDVESWMMPFSNGVIAVIVLIYLYRVITYGRTHKH